MKSDILCICGLFNGDNHNLEPAEKYLCVWYYLDYITSGTVDDYEETEQ